MWLRLVEKGVAVTDIAERSGVSRNNVYKWLKRARESAGPNALKNRSAARHTQNRFQGKSLGLLVALRKARPELGAVRLIAMVRADHPTLKFPAASTLTEHLAKLGLIIR